MSNVQLSSSNTSTVIEEPKYPEREFALERMNAKERNSGAICFKFQHEFRQSNFYFTFSLSQQRDQILLPPRSSLVQHIQEVSPNYQFPSCLSNKDLATEKKKATADDENADIIKFEYKKTTYAADEEAEEDQEDQEGNKKDSDSENQEEYSEEDIGDFDINRYNDNETGEDNDDDDSGDDDD